MTPRSYLPATLEQLGRWVEAGQIPDGVERVLAADQDEEAEYAALCTAADAAAEQLAAGAEAGRRRVVVVAETGNREGPIPMHQVVAVHADPVEGADPEDDLGWYAVQEIPDLL